MIRNSLHENQVNRKERKQKKREKEIKECAEQWNEMCFKAPQVMSTNRKSIPSK